MVANALPERSARRLPSLRQRIVADIETNGGRHDELEIYSGTPGDPGLCGGARSISWEINGDLASLVIGGTGAILMELLHPSVMAGVYTQSSVFVDPMKRARNTLGYVLRTTFGTTEAATRVIEGVKRVHGYIRGERPDGVPYRALDPELIAWVHTSIPWAVMNAFDRYARPLSLDEKNRYLREQALIGRMGGADWVPESVPELEDYVERMRPQLGVNEQLIAFLDFISGADGKLGLNRLERLDRWVSLRAGMGIMPAWSRRLTGTNVPELMHTLWLRPGDRLKARIVRWAYGELPCKRLALERVSCEARTAIAR